MVWHTGKNFDGTMESTSQRFAQASETSGADNTRVITPTEPVASEPGPEITAVLPPSDNVPLNRNDALDSHSFDQRPWSKLAIASLILGLVSLPFGFSASTASFSAFMALVGFVLGIVGLVLMLRRKNRYSTLLAKLAIILCLVMVIIASMNTAPSTSTTAQTSTSASADASRSAQIAASEKAAQKAEKLEAEKEQAEKLDEAKSTLTSKINEARALLDSSNNNVADPQTRTNLTDAIDKATATNSDDPAQYNDALQPLQSAMNAVNGSVEQKKQNDAAAQAAQAAAAAQAKADADAAAQASAQAQEQAPAQAQAPAPADPAPQQQSSRIVNGGAFCSPEGATGLSTAGNTLTCKIASDGRLRWKK
ncbi:hypothetical protein [Bifidobacterium aquikefiricola]|uniref:Uncharacterized protein n=1 Tax=Bifidobacterium aquikefiricola TaxID=3059038 RepID=A0AB39U5M6_9BIFI